MNDDYRINTILVGCVCAIVTIALPHPVTFIVGAGVTVGYYFAEKRR